MYAAVVRSFGRAPTFEEFPTPQPAGEYEALVDVVASGLHPRVRSQAAGSHYTSTDELPLVPGIDGVGLLPSGKLVYFVMPDTTVGAMAEHTVIDTRRSVELPADADPLLVAAGMNPAMSSWVALRKRVNFTAGQGVLVLGATGSAGQLAVQIAKRLGAGYVIGAGRDAGRLALLGGLGADDVVSLEGDPLAVAERLGQAARDVDVVIDYVWGNPAENAMLALVTRRTDPSKELNWIQIGSLGGRTASIPSAALRSTNLRILGSGQGSVRTHDIVAELPTLAAELSAGRFALNVHAEPLSRVEPVWTAPTNPAERIVLTP